MTRTEQDCAIRLDRVGLSTVQDAGRPGFAHLGVPRSGAADRTSFALANRLAGNANTAAVLETSGGLAVTALCDITVVLTGADSEAFVGDHPLARCKAISVAEGETLRVDRLRTGTRAYLAISGGITGVHRNDETATNGRALLGSLSHDVLSGFIPVPLQSGSLLRIGEPASPPSSLDLAVDFVLSRRIQLTEGPHFDLFASESLQHFARTTWNVSPTSNRVGIRLADSSPSATHESSFAAALKRASLGELASIPLVRGAVQVTPSGELVVLVADHPTTGGYPVIGVVALEDVDALVQQQPGSAVTFSWST